MPVSLFPSDYRVRRESLPLLPAHAKEISILHISDLHLTSRDKKQQEWLKSLHRLQPDFVVGTGDYLGGNELPILFDSLRELLAIPGAFVLGSNDYFAPTFKSPHRYLLKDSRTSHAKELPWQELVREFERHWINLTHRKTTTTIKEVTVELRGTDDGHLDRDQSDRVSGPASSEIAIGVTHAPYRRILDAFERDGIDLIFAGHTHGGQWCLPGGRALVTNCDLEPKYARGISHHGASTLEVCAGSGTSPFAPLRLFCPPEAALVTLTARPPH